MIPRLIRIKRRANVLEGYDPGPGHESNPDFVNGVADLLDDPDPNPQIVVLQWEFLGMLDREVDVLERRQSRIDNITAAVHRQAWRIIDGGRHD
jgi:hypothetical protein